MHKPRVLQALAIVMVGVYANIAFAGGVSIAAPRGPRARLVVGNVSGSPATAGARLFSPSSIWNRPLTGAARVARNSPGIVGHLNQFIKVSIARQNGPWINTSAYSTPVYTVPANQPAVPVDMDYYNPSLSRALAAVPIPRGARAAAGSDAEMTVYQPGTNTLWEMFDMRQALNPPPFLSAVVTSGGSLAPGRYYYTVTARTRSGETTHGPIQSYDVPRNGMVALRWNGPVGSTSYRIYRGHDESHLALIATVAHTTTRLEDPNCVWTDAGSRRLANVSPPATDTARTPGHWHAEWAGRILHESSDPGYYRRIPDVRGGFTEDYNWGATASSLPVAGGLITLGDLAAGNINHAVAMMVPEAARNVIYFPAQRTDGFDSSRNAVPEGARFRLDPRLDLSKLKMPPVTRMIAEAAQRYGLIVDDQTAATVGFRAQDPEPMMRRGHRNPYVKYFTDPATGQYAAPNRLLASFPWSHLQLLAPPRRP